MDSLELVERDDARLLGDEPVDALGARRGGERALVHVESTSAFESLLGTGDPDGRDVDVVAFLLGDRDVEEVEPAGAVVGT